MTLHTPPALLIPALQRLPPKSTRQTLLYSATFAPNVRDVAMMALRESPPHVMVDTVGDSEVQTHKIPQAYTVTSMEDQIPAVMHACLEASQTPGHKVIVFLTTARQTQLFAQVYNSLPG